MTIIATCRRQPWNKGKLVGQKTPLQLRDIWAIRVRLQIAEKNRDLALFDLAIDSKLRACDLTKFRVRDVAHCEHLSSRAMVMQQKTQRPVQFEITDQTRSALEAWIHRAQPRSEDYLFPSQLDTSDHLSTLQYARIVKGSVKAVGLDPAMYGTHNETYEGNTELSQDEEPAGGGSCCSAIRSWRALFDTWGLRSMTPWRWRNRLRFGHV